MPDTQLHLTHAKVIAVASQKGGVAKTTTVIHLGAALAEMGKKVLLVDLDPQGHLAEGFGMEADRLPSEMSDVLEGAKRMVDIIIPDVRTNLDLAPSNIRLADMELTLVSLRFREQKLKRAMEPVLRHYDYIIMDCPPSLGLLTVNGLIAAHYVLVPMASEFYSMLGVSLLIKTVQNLQEEGNQELTILGIIPTRHKRTVHAREVVTRVTDELGDRFPVFDPIAESTRFTEAAGQGKTVYEIAPDTPGAVTYRAIAERILNG